MPLRRHSVRVWVGILEMAWQTYLKTRLELKDLGENLMCLEYESRDLYSRRKSIQFAVILECNL